MDSLRHRRTGPSSTSTWTTRSSTSSTLPARRRSRSLEEYEDKDDIPGIFALMDPMPGAIEAVHTLAEHYDVYVLSTAPWANPSAWSDKVEWIQRHFGYGEDSVLYKRLILSHHKDLNRGRLPRRRPSAQERRRRVRGQRARVRVGRVARLGERRRIPHPDWRRRTCNAN